MTIINGDRPWWRRCALACAAVALLLLAAPVSAQTVDDYLDKARLEANLLQNTTDRTVYACERDQRAKCIEEAKKAAREARRSLYAIDRAIEVYNAPVVTPPPVDPPPVDPPVEPPHHPPVEPPVITYPKVGDVVPVASDLNVPALLGPVGIPPSASPDVVGAFRFVCGPGQVISDDPIVYPGQPGRAHPHQFFSNLEADANSTYESLRKSGDSTCQNPLNRSSYWLPAMLDGKGSVVRPDYISIYYKRRPKSDPSCTTVAKECVGIPRGLRFVFGWDQTRPDVLQPENATRTNFSCVEGWSPFTPSSKDMVPIMAVCKPGQRLHATLSTPDCWDGVNLDTPNHRSHLADMKWDGNAAKFNCPTTHPKIIPQFTMTVAYAIEAGDQPTLWGLSSDSMIPAAIRRPGASLHSDYFEAWEDDIRLRWEAACIDKKLNCSDGNLGDGQILARGPHYPTFKASPRLVPVPAQHTAH